MKRLLKRLDTFLFHYHSVRPFGFLRIATAFVCLLLLISMRNDMQNLIGLNGYLGRDVTESVINSSLLPRISWLINPLIKIGFTDATSIDIIIGVYFIALLFMLAGLLTRPSVFIVWVIHIMIFNSAEIFTYGVDAFTNVLLFYCLIMPANNSLSLDNFLFKKRKKKYDPVYESFYMRVLQVHICIGYFFGGIGKLIMPGWVSGNSIWQSLMPPNYSIVDFSFLAGYPFITTMIGFSVVALELFYPVMVYFDKTRKLWLIGIILMHAFIGCFMLLPFFGLVMIIFNMAAFGWDEFYPFLSNSFNRFALLLQPKRL